jgi:hypothetical protein
LSLQQAVIAALDYTKTIFVMKICHLRAFKQDFPKGSPCSPAEILSLPPFLQHSTSLFLQILIGKIISPEEVHKNSPKACQAVTANFGIDKNPQGKPQITTIKHRRTPTGDRSLKEQISH